MKKARLILGITLLPLFGVIYFLDRILVICMPWIEHANIGKWFSGKKEMTESFIRVLTIALIFGIYSLILWIL